MRNNFRQRNTHHKRSGRAIATLKFIGVAIIIGFSILQTNIAISKTVLDMQAYKLISTKEHTSKEGKLSKISLINLNSNVSKWYILRYENITDKTSETFHIQNPKPENQKFTISATIAFGIDISAGGNNTSCDLNSESIKKSVSKSVKNLNAYTELCDGKIQIRNAIEGRHSSKEAVASFLRKHIWGGEKITSLVKQTIYKDKFMIQIEKSDDGRKVTGFKNRPGPQAAKLSKENIGRLLPIDNIGIPVSDATAKKFIAGTWYSSKFNKNTYISAIEPGTIETSILESNLDRTSKLDNVESKAISYMVAFDMDHFEFSYAVGTEHPSVEWSKRVPAEVKKSGVGPDGIETLKPIIGTGRITNAAAQNIAATFTGGFKRSHSGFRHGHLSKNNNGSHYGFMEEGVLLSTLQPELATIVIDQNNKISMKTWTKKDNLTTLSSIRHARQNGVAIIDGIDPITKLPIPGIYVNKWGKGNWSGSIDSKERALRSGACIANHEGKQYLIYGYFSTATPSAMARVFQSYNCEYAIHLDMNALEHTYLATYSFEQGEIAVHNLMKGMKVLDRHHEGKVSPRFIGLSDNRDFFYLTHKKTQTSSNPTNSDKDSKSIISSADSKKVSQ